MKPAALVLAAALLTPALPALAHDEGAAAGVFAATTLNLAAFGETKVTPDQATISIGVTSQAATAQEAMRLNNTQMNRVVAAIRGQGVAERDVQTSGLNLNPQQVYRENQPPQVTGYQASNTVTVTVQDLARLGPVVDAVVAAGSNTINNVSFGLKDPTAAEDAARRAAVKALQAKAALYAQATGHRVRRLVNLSEGTSYSSPPPPMPYARMVSAEAAMDKTSVSPGELRVRVDVSGVFELERPL